MGNTCQDQPVPHLEVVDLGNLHQNDPQNDNKRQQQDFDLPVLGPNAMHSKRSKNDFIQSKSFTHSSIVLPELNEKVQNSLDKQLERKPLAGPPLSFSNHPKYLKQQQAYYQGDWLEGQPHGKGSIYFQSGAYFQGELVDGEVDCSDGLLVLPDGSYYRGQFRRSLFDGKGTFNSALGTTYTGDWLEGVPHGKGQEHFPDGNSYQGSFQDGMKSGEGIFRWQDGKVYEGQFKNGMMNGHGKFYKGDKEFFEGEFNNNKKMGKNKLRTQYGVYTGQFVDGAIIGQGTFQWNDQTLYEGQFKNGHPHGDGILKLPQGRTLTGRWEEGKNINIKHVKSGRSQKRSSSRSKSRHSAREQ